MKEAKIVPIPIPEPITPITASPAPSNFAASISMGNFLSVFYNLNLSKLLNKKLMQM